MTVLRKLAILAKVGSAKQTSNVLHSKTVHRRLRHEQCEARIALHAGHGDDETSTASPAVWGPPEIREVSPAPIESAVQPLSALPILEGLPSAQAKLYLDFNGASYDGNTYPAFSRDSDATTFSDNELKEIKDIWGRVVEFFSPFKIDVTTKDPISYTANRVSRIVIVNDNGGGWAYVGSFNGGGGGFGRVGDDGWGDAANMAFVIAHEAGHTFGLSHQSVYDGDTKTQEYNPGASDKGPIMGAPYGSDRQLWWKGPAQSNNPAQYQDDMRVLARAENGFGYRQDEAGRTIEAPANLQAQFGEWATSGVITTTADVDVYKIEIVDAGSLNFRLNVANNDSAMLDARIELWDADGNVLVTADPSGQNASLVRAVTPGTYHAVVASHGSYGDVGQYSLSVNMIATPWRQQVIGAASATARLVGDAGMIEGVGSGPRLTSDTFNFVYQDFTGDAEISAKVDDLDDTLRFLRAGVSFREGSVDDAKHASVYYTPLEGVRFSYRTAQNENTLISDPIPVEGLPYLRLTRSGDAFVGEYSLDGSTWQAVGDAVVEMAATVRAGLFSAGAPTSRDRRINYSQITLNSIVRDVEGDVNGDRSVDLLDFSILRENFGRTEALRDQGDLNGDTLVNLLDFAILRANFSSEEPAEARMARQKSRVHQGIAEPLGQVVVGVALSQLSNDNDLI